MNGNILVTGHLSVSDLQPLSLKKIKIDKSFITNFVTDPRSGAMSITEMTT